MDNINQPLDPEDRARIRWRARRGLLENDLIIQRFFDTHELLLSDADVQALTELFELTDNNLLDILLARKELEGELDKPAVRKVVQMMRDL